MTAETYDDLKRFVGSKNDFADDLLNMGYIKGYGDAKRVFENAKVKSIQEYETAIRADARHKVGEELMKVINEKPYGVEKHNLWLMSQIKHICFGIPRICDEKGAENGRKRKEQKN